MSEPIKIGNPTIVMLKVKVNAFVQLFERKPRVFVRGHFEADDGSPVFFDRCSKEVLKIGRKHLTVEADGRPCKVKLPATSHDGMVTLA